MMTTNPSHAAPLRRIYERPPSMVPAWTRAVTAGGKRPAAPPTGETLALPNLELELWPQRADPGHLARYKQLCGFTGDQRLPLPYPQLMAGSLHFHMLTDPQFPLPPAGLVHLGNHIEQTRPLRPDDPIHFACRFGTTALTARGLEFELLTQATVYGEPVWRSVLTILSRAVRDEAAAKAKATQTASGSRRAPPALPGTPLRSLLLRVPEDTGRRYAAVAGDYNPIHLHLITAKLFGFPRAIAHGMWTFSRTLAEASDDLPPGPLQCDVRFSKPVLLPSTVQLRANRIDSGVAFAMSNRDGSTQHLSGQVVTRTAPTRPFAA